MTPKRFKILIQSPADTMDEFERSWKLVSKRQSKGTSEMILCFKDLSLVSRVLSRERLRIIQAIRKWKPASINQLAKFLRREQANVYRDVQYLSKLGILELQRRQSKGGRRSSLRPVFGWQGFEIAVA
ncbi:MAG TPA: hypothetical protein VI895_03130 [Bdellovibrionota bacterium]|nr:hypothetical protein [Bdellovibrionota bacterium]